MSETYSTEYIDQYISQLSSVEDAFNIYRETGSLEELHRLNNDTSSKLYLQKWLDFAKLPESDRALAQLKTPSFNKARLSPYADIMLHCQKQWRSTLDLIHIVFVYQGSFSCEMKGRKFTLTQGKCYMFNVNVTKKILPAGATSQLLNCLISQNYLENILLKQFDRSIYLGHTRCLVGTKKISTYSSTHTAIIVLKYFAEFFIRLLYLSGIF